MSNKEHSETLRWLVCGAFAGLAVDLALYPIDTIKTRLQSEKGFLKSGGFKNIYKGIGAVALGAAPGSAAFFVTYKKLQDMSYCNNKSSLTNAFCASIGEISACIIRVPTEHIKQLAQTSRYKAAKDNLIEILKSELKLNGFMGLYRGYFSTISREIPFSFIQFPIWEKMKIELAKQRNKDKCSPFESAICGSIAGSFSAFITTPFDVAKTRIMLDINNNYKKSILNVWKNIINNEKIKQLYAGASVRTMWIGVGGFVYFFGYEFSMKMWENVVY
uniref:S-adenosylmethionine mitochondrial carrier protein (inferred by orthology to a human protein) n=1 Tax=Strongyloides venezuelensis TaxID=75913 RepID=A0A0K0F8P4_STRVS